MATFELLVLVVGILVSLCSSGFALLECSKLLRTVDRYQHDVGILENLYKEVRANVVETVDELGIVVARVDNVIDTNNQILDYNKSVTVDIGEIRNDISMLQVRLEDTDDNS